MTTAIEIGKSCKLLTPDLELVMLEHTPPEPQPGDEGFGQPVLPVTQRLKLAHEMHCSNLASENSNSRFSMSTNRLSSSGAGSGGGGGPKLGLVVDGPSLTDILGNEAFKAMLLDLACSCAAVVACRVSPAQKQLIVKMVKDGLPTKVRTRKKMEEMIDR